MNKKILLGGALAALLLTGACSTATNSNNANNSNAANKNTATTTATATPTPAGSPAMSPAANQTAGAAQDFMLHNKTGVVIDKLFVSPSDKEDWQEDVLGQDQLADGQSVEIKFHPKETAPKWDIKVVDTEGTSIEWHDLNLTEISEVTLHFENGKGTAEVK
jgi:ABC-type transport system substrate-binding protein